MQRAGGHVFVVEPNTGRQWYAKWRDHHGQHQKCLGPAWVEKTHVESGSARARPRATGFA
jgi:hypothetical protein